MPIWSEPSDKDYHGPAIYRLIVNGQNYCGKTFRFRPRMREHKSAAKHWRKNLEKGCRVSDVHKLIDDNFDDVAIEIIARYPDKIKGVEADELFLKEREIAAIAFYDSFHNGLNKDLGGSIKTKAHKDAQSRLMMGNQHCLGLKRTEAQIQAHRQFMRGNNFNASRRKSLTATMGDKQWSFESTMQASPKLEEELGIKYGRQGIGKAAAGKCGKTNPHIYKGIHFIYD